MNIALILSGGAGTRLGAGTPKQYLRCGGKMLVSWTLNRVWQSGAVDVVQIAAEEAWRARILEEAPTGLVPRFSWPGETRQATIRNALRDIAARAAPTDAVLVHDAVRPFVSAGLIARCFAALPGHDGVMPVLPMTDTVYYSASGAQAEELLERSRIYAGQAPEAFRLGPYLEANESLPPDVFSRINGASEPALLAGLDVVMIPGEQGNFKVTTREDWARCQELLGGGEE